MPELTIGVDVHSIGNEKGGNETYYRELMNGIAGVPNPHRFYFYFTNPLAHKWLIREGNFQNRRLKPGHPLLRIPFVLPLRTIRDRLDVFHAQYILPPFLKCKTVVSIFDLAHERFPEFFEPAEAKRSRLLVRQAAEKADHVITVSNFSARDIERMYGVRREKICVTYLAAGKEFRQIDQNACRERLEKGFGLSSPFILYAGRLQARKNLVRLIEAYAELRKDGVEEKLVLVGKPDWRSNDLSETVQKLNLEHEVIFLGYVASDDLPYLYNRASVFVFPSIFEGFGLPVLESMACGTPTITSLGSSLEEVAGDAALLVDPLSVQSIKGAMQEVLGSSSTRDRLRSRGLARASQFSYEDAARRTIQVYESL